MNELLPFQEKGVDFLTSGLHKLLADDMGLGKTIQAITAFERLASKRILIICPAAMKIGWKREIEKWSKRDLRIDIVNGVKHQLDLNANVTIVNYDLLNYPTIQNQFKKYVIQNQREKSHLRPWDVGICDESHYLKEFSAKRSKAVIGKTGVLAHCGFKWMLTGTPVLNRPSELYLPLVTLHPRGLGEYKTWNDYARRYCFRKTPDGYDFKGANHLEELSARLDGFMLRRTKKQVLPELPPCFEQIIMVGTPDFYEDDQPVATARREIGEAKIPGSVAHIRDVLEQVPKIVIFAYHRNVIEHFTKLPIAKTVSLMGGSTAQQKQDAIDQFINDPETRIFIGQLQAAGQGIDGLQKVCSHVIFLEFDWAPGVMDQARDRLCRMGQNQSVLIQYLISDNEMEQKMVETLRKKRNVITTLIENKKEFELMTLEASLERIANALEALANKEGAAYGGTGNGGTAKEDKPVAAKAAPKKAKVEEPVASEDGLTLDDVRTAAGNFVNSSTDIPGNQTKARNVFKKHGADTMAELKPGTYAGVIADLEALLNAASASDGLDNL